jgi:hypothetical protein
MTSALSLIKSKLGDENHALAFDQLVNALRAGQLAAKANRTFDKSSAMPKMREIDLAPEIWDDAYLFHDILDDWALPHWAVVAGEKSSEGWLLTGVSVLDSDVRRIWLSEDLQVAPVSHADKKRGGAPSKIDWEKCLIEAARHVMVNGLPRTQADLIAHLLAWCQDSVSETTMKGHIAPFYREIERELGREPVR